MKDEKFFKIVIAKNPADEHQRVCFIDNYRSKDEAIEDVQARMSDKAEIILMIEAYPPKFNPHSQQQADSPEIEEGHEAIVSLMRLSGFRQAFAYILGEVCSLIR